LAEATPPTADPNARAELGRTPVPGGDPAGEPPNDAPEFEELREEATKDPVQGPPSWERVAKLGEGILRDKSKDFVVASYTAVALAQIDGVAGLHDGLRILDGLCRTYWDSGSPPVPKRLRARANAVNWFAEKTGQLLERAEFMPRDVEQLEASLETANALSDVLGEKFTDGEVGLGPVLAALREASKRVSAEAAAARPPERPTARPAQAAGPGAASAPAAPDEISSRSDAEAAVRRATQFVRQQNAAAPEAYGLPRVMAWGPLRQAPPVQDGVTMIPPPSRGAVESAAGGPPDALVAAAEQAFAAAPLWLDLQRHVVQGLEQQGASHRAARDLVVALTRDLIERVPALASLQFSDGSPLADELTRQWLAEQVAAGGGGAAAAAMPAAAASVDAAALAELRRDAQPLVKKGQLSEVRARLAELFADDPTPRGRFQERLELATLCFEGGRDQVALAMLEGLDAEMAGHELDGWDPALAARVLQSLYRVHVKVIGKKDLTPEQSARRAEVFGRLCRLDPALAAALE